MKKILPLAALAVTQLIGCGVYTVPLEEAKLIPQGREVYSACRNIDLRDPKANLFIIRDGQAGLSNPHIIFINGDPCTELNPEEKLALHLTPGSYFIGSKIKFDPFSTDRFTEVVITIAEGKTYIIREGSDGRNTRSINLSSK